MPKRNNSKIDWSAIRDFGEYLRTIGVKPSDEQAPRRRNIGVRPKAKGGKGVKTDNDNNDGLTREQAKMKAELTNGIDYSRYLSQDPYSDDYVVAVRKPMDEFSITAPRLIPNNPNASVDEQMRIANYNMGVNRIYNNYLNNGWDSKIAARLATQGEPTHIAVVLLMEV